jgi:hypothetical protein
MEGRKGVVVVVVVVVVCCWVARSPGEVVKGVRVCEQQPSSLHHSNQWIARASTPANAKIPFMVFLFL